jgi:Galactose oxidase, central domain/EGF-like domain
MVLSLQRNCYSSCCSSCSCSCNNSAYTYIIYVLLIIVYIPSCTDAWRLITPSTGSEVVPALKGATLNLACTVPIQLSAPDNDAAIAAACPLSAQVLVAFGGLGDSRFTSAGVPFANPGGLCPSLDGCNQRGTCVANVSCTCDEGYIGDRCEYEEKTEVQSAIWTFWLYNQSWTSLDISSSQSEGVDWPFPRAHHAAVVVNGSRLVIHAGASRFCTDYCSDLWQYDMLQSTWSNIAVNAVTFPTARFDHSAMIYGDRLYICGGFLTSGIGFSNDVWYFSFVTAEWKQVVFSLASSAPSKRTGHSMFRNGDQWYLFGGFWEPPTFSGNSHEVNSVFYLNDLWRLDLATHRWHIIESASNSQTVSRRAHAGLVAIDDTLVLFGGEINNEFYQDLWRFNLTSLQWIYHEVHVSFASPSPRAAHAMVYHPSLHELFMFGGETSYATGTVFVIPTFSSELFSFGIDVCPDNCNNRGTCSFGLCFCHSQFFGPDCQETYCNSSVCTYDRLGDLSEQCTHCSSRGDCVRGLCLCNRGYGGSSCQLLECKNGCSGHGTCLASVDANGDPYCNCNAGYYSDDCSKISCPNDCSGRGECDGLGTCICSSVTAGTYGGADCSAFFPSAAFRAAAPLSIPLVAFISLCTTLVLMSQLTTVQLEKRNKKNEGKKFAHMK